MADVVTLLRAAPVKIVGGLGEPGTEPEISRSRIVFNGEEESGYETFALFRRVGGHGFCKTGFSEIHKYDLLVKAVLIAADDRAPYCWRITSDSFDFEWAAAQAFAQEVLNRKLELPRGVASNWMMKDEYRQGPLYEHAKEAYLAAIHKGGSGPDMWRYGPQPPDW
jgi:hypothetical protein